MSNKSFKQMIQAGEVKRADAMRIKYEDIHVEPGFNLRDTTTPEFQEELNALVRHMERGGKVPALEVRPREEGGVWLVDGHRRHMAYGQLIERGQPIEWVPIEQFVGNDVDRTARIMTSNEGMKLKPLEIAEGYRRLAAYGLTPDDIARRVVKTRQHVDQMLILANAPHAVHQMVANGEVSATLALQTVRTHGDKAVHVLEKAKSTATKPKITASAVKPWAPPAKVVVPVVHAVSSLLDSLDNEDRLRVHQAGEPHGVHDAMVSVNARELFDLAKAFGEVEDARRQVEERRRAKQAEAAQGDLVDEAGADRMAQMVAGMDA